ncbi:MAG: hypothetical protein P1P89_19200 [Desulfobacterales bacterium]|nr:hypothetical protein [Desulfobacterales bacterium]
MKDFKRTKNFMQREGEKMGRKILVAFDDSKNAMRAVQFVAESFSPDNNVTLLSVLQNTAALCEMNSPELTPYFVSQQDSFCVLEDKKKVWWKMRSRRQNRF